jgi:hypothetical protein
VIFDGQNAICAARACHVPPQIARLSWWENLV